MNPLETNYMRNDYMAVCKLTAVHNQNSQKSSLTYSLLNQLKIKTMTNVNSVRQKNMLHTLLQKYEDCAEHYKCSVVLD